MDWERMLCFAFFLIIGRYWVLLDHGFFRKDAEWVRWLFQVKSLRASDLSLENENWVWSSLRHLLLNHLQLRLQTQAVQLKPNLRRTGFIYFCFKIYGMNSIFHELLHMQYITCKLVLSGVWRSTFTSLLGDEKKKHQNEPWCISLTSDSYPNLASERKAFVSSLCIIHTLKFCTVDRPRETTCSILEGVMENSFNITSRFQDCSFLGGGCGSFHSIKYGNIKQNSHHQAKMTRNCWTKQATAPDGE